MCIVRRGCDPSPPPPLPRPLPIIGKPFYQLDDAPALVRVREDVYRRRDPIAFETPLHHRQRLHHVVFRDSRLGGNVR